MSRNSTRSGGKSNKRYTRPTNESRISGRKMELTNHESKKIKQFHRRSTKKIYNAMGFWAKLRFLFTGNWYKIKCKVFK